MEVVYTSRLSYTNRHQLSVSLPGPCTLPQGPGRETTIDIDWRSRGGVGYPRRILLMEISRILQLVDNKVFAFEVIYKKK